MNKSYLLFFIVFSSVLLTEENCDFNSSNFIDELLDPSNIEVINVTIHDSRKYTKNSLAIITSREENIKEEFKKNFNASLKVDYKFGSCTLDSRAAINGDWKSHISFINGKIFNSLKFKVKEGNIVSKVKFKLLLPETRNGINEVFATLVLRKLGYLSPLTFITAAEVNKTKGVMLFQETVSKELLESNNRREGPIFEGDESLTWLKNEDYGLFDLLEISGARLVNNNWALKGNTSASISLNSFTKLQTSYLETKIRPEIDTYYINPNDLDKKKIFSQYHAYVLSLNGAHGLRDHNRQFYWNSIEGNFEPIYYDGDVEQEDITKNVEFNDIAEGELGLFFNEFKEVNFEELILKLRNINNTLFIEEFSKLSKLSMRDSLKYVDKFINQTISNLRYLEKSSKEFSPTKKQHSSTPLSIYDNLYEKSNSLRFKDNYLELKSILDLNKNMYSISCIKEALCGDDTISQEELINLISRNQLDGKRQTLVKASESLDNKINTMALKDGSLSMLYSLGAYVSYSKKGKELVLEQRKHDDWFLIHDSKIEDLTVIFRGLFKNRIGDISSQRFNEKGLTGCLTIYNSVLKKLRINAQNGSCEDIVNIMSSNGEISEIKISSAEFDALDVDFSKLSIGKLSIKDAGNDCMDFSSGEYIVDYADLKECRDKAISIGEASNFTLIKGDIKNANIGVSSKDSSHVLISDLDGQDLITCLESKKKKQEFNGALLIIGTSNCNLNNSFKDKYSNITIPTNKNDL